MGHAYNRREMVADADRQAPLEPKRRPKVLESIRLKKSANGGLMAEHEFDNSGPGAGYHERETHTFGKDEHRKAMEHVVKHLGLKEAKEPGATSGQANKETDAEEEKEGE